MKVADSSARMSEGDQPWRRRAWKLGEQVKAYLQLVLVDVYKTDIKVALECYVFRASLDTNRLA